MKKLIIFTVLLILVAGGSFFFGVLICRSTQRAAAAREAQLNQEDTDDSSAESPAAPAVTQNPFISFLVPDMNAQKGVQKAFSDKSHQVFFVWETLNAANGVINLLQTAGGEALSPVDSIMKKISNQLSFAFSLILFWKILLALSGFMVFFAVIPVCALVIIVMIWTCKDRRNVHRIIIASLLIGLIIPFAIPASLQISSLMENNFLSGNINSLVASIGEKRETADTMESAVSAARRHGTSAVNYIENAKTLGNDLTADIMNYFVMFTFVYLVIPVLFLLALFFLARYFIKLIQNRQG